MDGPQLKHRWPARYATVLSDDPGASVLTFTSMGLIARTEHNGRDRNRTVGLWRERSGNETPVVLRNDAHAVLLTLTGDSKSSTLIDGRKGPDRTEWSLGGMVQIKGNSEGEQIAPWILNGQFPEKEQEISRDQ